MGETMREEELLEHADCSICNRKIGACGVPLFWTAEIKRHGLKIDAIRRQDGLAALIGSPVIANALGPDEEMTEELISQTITICEECATQKEINIMAAVSGDY